MISMNIEKFDLYNNTYEIVLELIKATEVSFTEIIIFGDSFGQVALTESDNLNINKSTLSIVYETGDRFVVNQGDIAAFKVIR